MTATLTQTDAVLALLHSRPAGITALEALSEIGCFRLAARVAELRAEGWVIASRSESANGKHFVRYQLVKDATPWKEITESEQRALWGDR
jgi:hypothetical protein